MLIPFDRNIMHIETIKGKYISSAINDLLRFEKNLSGYILVTSTDSAGYVFFRDNVVMNAAAYLYSASGGMPLKIDFKTIVDLDSVSLYANILDDNEIMEHLYGYFFSFYSMSVPFLFINMARVLAFIKDNSYTGVLSFQHGFVINMMYFNKGVFQYFMYYHPDTKSYALEKNWKIAESYIGSLESQNPAVAMKDSRHNKKVFDSELFFFQKDAIVNLMFCYFDLFNMIVDQLVTISSPEKTGEEINDVIGRMKEKYAPLFSKVVFDAKRNSVNWGEVFYDRRFVPLQYRFEQYHLYLDEMLKEFISVMKKMNRDIEDTRIFFDKLRLYFASYNNDDDAEIRKLFYRVERLFESVYKISFKR